MQGAWEALEMVRTYQCGKGIASSFPTVPLSSTPGRSHGAWDSCLMPVVQYPLNNTEECVTVFLSSQ